MTSQQQQVQEHVWGFMVTFSMMMPNTTLIDIDLPQPQRTMEAPTQNSRRVYMIPNDVWHEFWPANSVPMSHARVIFTVDKVTGDKPWGAGGSPGSQYYTVSAIRRDHAADAAHDAAGSDNDDMGSLS